MAKNVTVVLTDDLDSSPAAETIPFALDGKSYEIDLSESNAKELRELLADFIGAARGASKTPQKRSSPTRDTQAIRAWAAETGVELNDRGRIPSAVVEAYQVAH